MSTGLSTVFVTNFDAQVKAAYQNGGMLRKAVRHAAGIKGSTHKFNKANRGVASPRISQTDVVPMGTGYNQVTATLARWHAADYIDEQDADMVNFAEGAILAGNIGAAIGRREDQIIIDALEAAKASADIAHGSAGLTFDKLATLDKLFTAAAVPEGRRWLLIEAEGKADLLAEAKLTSKDYVDRAVVETGKLPPLLMGFNIIVLDAARDEGGMTYTAGTPNIQKAYAWDQQAIGLATNGMDKPVKTDWVAEKNSWLFAQYMSAGAIAIDTAGIFELEYTV